MFVTFHPVDSHDASKSYRAPCKARPTDTGYDLYACEDMYAVSGQVTPIHTNTMAIFDGTVWVQYPVSKKSI